MKKSISIISILLVVAFIFTMPGFAFGASAIEYRLNASGNKDDSAPETEQSFLSAGTFESENPLEGVIPEDEKEMSEIERFKAALESGEVTILSSAQKSKSTTERISFVNNRISSILAAENTRTGGTTQNADMTKYLKTVTEPFTIANSGESVNLTNGSIGLTYKLADMTGINGNNLNLCLNYNSFDSNTEEAFWSDESEIEYYVISGAAFGYYDTTISEWVDFREYHDYEIFSDYDEYQDCIVSHNVHSPQTIVYNGFDGYYFSDHVFDDGSIYCPEVDIVPRTENPARNKLSPGWSFNIPSIETQNYYDFDTEAYDYTHKIITLDTGACYNIHGLEFTDRTLTDLTLTSGSYTVGLRTATYKLLLKNGTAYYFDSNGLALRKEDKFGNGISYYYSGSGISSSLSSISDDFGRTITLSYSGTADKTLTVTASDGESVTVSMSEESVFKNRRVSSINYGSSEIYSFTYSTGDTALIDIANFETDESVLNYANITKITYPNGDEANYTYAAVESPWGNGKAEHFFLSSRYDVISGVTKNSTSYTRTGNSYEASGYNGMDEEYKEEYGIEDYTYIVTVQSASRAEQYTFNEKNLCTYMSAGHKAVYTTYNSYNLKESSRVSDYGSGTGSYVESSESYTYDSKGNLTSYTDSLANVTSYTYEATFSMPLSVSYKQNAETTILTEYTLSADKKTAVLSETKVNGTLSAKTAFTYDVRGNVLTKTEYIFPGNETAVTSYSYSDNVTRPTGINMDGLYLTSVTVFGIEEVDSVTLKDYTETYKYDLAGRKTSSTNANGNTTTYTYNNRGKLTGTTYPDETTESFTYNITQNTVTSTDRAGYVLISKYDGLGNLVEIKENSTGIILETRCYDSAGRLSYVHNRNTSLYSSKTVYSYDSRNRITSVSVYDGLDNLVSREGYSFTVFGNGQTALLKTTKTIYGDANSPSIITTEYTNKAGYKVKTGRKLGEVEFLNTYTYDYSGNMLTETVAGGGTSTYTYNFAGKALTSTDALGNTVSSVYTSTGLPVSLQDALGNITTYTYDKLGRTLTVTVPVETTGGTTYRQVTKYKYDNIGNVTDTYVTNNAVGVATEAYTHTQNTYDNMDHLTKTECFNGETAALTTTYTYNNRDDVLTSSVGGKIVTNTYNIRGELTSVKDALNQTESYTYDANGNLITKTDRSGTLFTYTYNALGRVLTETASKNNCATQVNSYTYTATGLVRTETNFTLTVTRSYDTLGRLISETEADGTNTSVNEYTYTLLDLRATYKLTVNGTVRLWEYYHYDVLGRMTESGTCANAQVQVSYESAMLNSDGSTAYTYAIENVSDNGNTTEDVYIYNTASQTWQKLDIYTSELHPNSSIGGSINMTNGSFSGTAGYYEGGVCSESYNICMTPSGFEYENGDDYCYHYYVCGSSGNVAYTVFFYAHQEGSDVTLTFYVYTGDYGNSGYTCTSSVQYETIVIETPVVSYTYDANGNRLSVTYVNGMSTEYTYNSANLPKTIQNKKNNVVQSGFAYTYFLDGNIKTVTESSGKSTSYVYDALGRLTSETIIDNGTTTVVSYVYDNRGNRASMTENNAVTTYTYDDNNRLISESLFGNAKTYSYDANGNQRETTYNNNFVGRYGYDLFNRQVSFTANNIGYTYYTYRADGLRHSVGSTIHFWDGTNIVAEKTGTTVTVYFRSLNLIYSQTGNTKTFYVFNGHGDVIALTNASGTITRTYEYDAFGIEDEPSVYDTNPFRYCGEYYDTETKTLYLRARYYDASTGRFTAEDPIKDGANWYSYCGGNPVNFVDPMGLLPRKDVEMENLDDGYGNTQTETHKTNEEYNDSQNEKAETEFRDVTEEVDYALEKQCEVIYDLVNDYKTETDFIKKQSKKILLYASFYEMVHDDADWDIKNPDMWKKTIGPSFPEVTNIVIYKGNLITPEFLGNYTYGYLGAAFEFELPVLFAGSYYAAKFPIKGNAFKNEMMDWDYISYGYNDYFLRNGD